MSRDTPSYENVDRPKRVDSRECNANTVELHLPGLIGTASHPDMQKIRMRFFCENRLH